MSDSIKQVILLLPPGYSPQYPSLERMHDWSPRICNAIEKRGIEIIVKSWDGNCQTLPQDEPCLVHFSQNLAGFLGSLTQACESLNHLLFCSDRIYSGTERKDPTRAIEIWLESILEKTLA